MPSVTRRTAALSTVIGLLLGGIGMGAYSYPDEPAPTTPDPTALAPGESPKEKLASFSEASAGQCVTWTTGADGTVTDFTTVDCATPHRFEVSQRQDLDTYPSSEFGPSSDIPDMDRQAQLTQELCIKPTKRYLDGKFDPNGKFSIAPILPPPAAWKQGDRTLLCGLQITGPDGSAKEVQGTVLAQDQSRVYAPGTCVGVDPQSGTAGVVDCGSDHSYEVTQIIDLSKKFDFYPVAAVMDKYLADSCTQAARDYLGGDDALYNSTLEPFWTALPLESWNAGSRLVNCSLTKVNPAGSFSTLSGSAKGQFTIDGTPPPPQPPRRPKRDDAPPPPPAPTP